MQLCRLRIKKFSAGAEEDCVKFLQWSIFVCLKSVSNPSILKLVLFMLAPVLAQAQSVPYLLRMERTSVESNDCVLLQKTGFFHLESRGRDSTKVFEGNLSVDGLRRIQRDLHDPELQALSQEQIQEPLMHASEFLRLDLWRDDHWQELTFRSAESQEPYRRTLQPLLRWLNDLHKLPHKELSEDAGKNNCLAPGEIALKKRSDEAPSEPVPAAGANKSLPLDSSNPAAVKLQAVPALLQLGSMSMKSHVAHQACVLVMANGFYRAEQQEQKEGSKKVETRITGGKFTPEENSELQQLLNDPAIAGIHHRKTSHMTLPMSGEMLNLQIYRPSSVQNVVLSSTFNRRDVPFFYSGDGDIANAQPLLKFVDEHVWTAGSGRLDPSLRNDCQSAP